MEKEQHKRIRYIVARLGKLKEEAEAMKATASHSRDAIRAGVDAEQKRSLVEGLNYSRLRLAEIKGEIQVLKEERKSLVAAR